MKLKKSLIIAIFAVIAMVLSGLTLSVKADTEPLVQIGDKTYNTLSEAVSDVPNDLSTPTTIKVLRDELSGTSGIKTTTAAKDTKNIIIDFDGHTLQLGGPLVGSPGYESQDIHLEKGSKFTFKNGTIKASPNSAMLFQNYCDLTIEDMTIDATTSNRSGIYALSLNNGTVNIKGNTNIKSNYYAFDMCWWPKGYPDGAHITIDTTGKVEGTIQLDTCGTFTSPVKSTLDIKNINHSGNFDIESQLASQLNISGGIYSNEVDSKYLSEGKACKKIGDSYAVETEYSITAPEKVDNGSFSISTTKAIAGETVTITTKANEGYQANITVTDSKGNAITVNDGKFIMPDSAVTVKVEFTEFTQEAAVPSTVENAEKVKEIILEALKSDEEYAELIASNNVEVSVELEEVLVSEEEQAELEEALNKKVDNCKIAKYLDITITVINKDSGEVIGTIPELGEKITFTVGIPADLPKVADGYTRIYYIVRNHNGVIDVLDTELSADGKNISFSSDKFSTYAIAYTDIKVDDAKDETPKTGKLDITLYVSVAISVITLAGIVIAKKHSK